MGNLIFIKFIIPCSSYVARSQVVALPCAMRWLVYVVGMYRITIVLHERHGQLKLVSCLFYGCCCCCFALFQLPFDGKWLACSVSQPDAPVYFGN